jgi:amino acid adenylation domain-containing protein
MEDFTPFPCQLGHSTQQQQKSWASQSVLVELGKQAGSCTSKDLEATINLAFAVLVWKFAGHADVRYLLTTLDEQSLRYSTCSVAINSGTTIVTASTQIASSSLETSSVDIAAPSALIHSSRDFSVDSRNLLQQIPLQIWCRIDQHGSRLHLNVWYEDSSVTAFHAKRYGHELSHLVQAIWHADENESISNLATVTHEDETFIKSLNSTPQDIDLRTIHECVSLHAADRPHEVAIDAWDGALSRQQLESESNRLVKILVENGVTRGCVVSIILDKSKWAAVSMLAVLKAGGVFLLLEPGLPFERLDVMVKKAACSHAITSPGHTSLACSLVSSIIAITSQGQMAAVDTGATSCTTSIKDQALPEVSPYDAAFLIFTSGSSGIPKAVVTQHFAWVTGYTQHVHKFGIQEGTRVFQYASYNFVVSILDTISTLLVGGTVCIPSTEERVDDLENAIRRLRPDYICMTPSVAKAVDPTAVPSIKTLVLVGEPIPRALAETWLTKSGATLRNGYGQSEACSMNSTAVLTKSTTSFRTIGNSSWLRYWIVDPCDHDRLMSVGGLGELLVEGYSVAKGYFSDPVKTAAAFIQGPAWASRFDAGTDGRRWYKTGDLVQYQGNGELFLYGRKDAQLKIHGQRLEAAEVEHHILKSLDSKISQAVVDKISNADGAGGEKLVAFVKLSEGVREAAANSLEENSDEQCEHQIRREMFELLKTSIPTWMIPTKVVLVEQMNRTATGKLDRRALKEAHSKRFVETSPGPEAEMPRKDSKSHTSQEETICPELATMRLMWSEILKVNQNMLAPTSSWVESGGDSMTAMLLAKRARAEGYHVTSADILSGTMLEQLSQSLVATSAFQQERHTNGEIARDSPAPVTDYQHRNLIQTQGSFRQTLYKYEIRLRGTFDFEQLQLALHLWIEKTESLRIKFDKISSGAIVQSVIPADSTEWQCRLKTHASADELALVSSKHDFVQHPLLASLQRQSTATPDCLILAIQIHHAIFDGMSWNLLLDDLVLAYRGLRLPARPSYIDYLHNRLLKRTPESLNYWRQLLQGSSPTTLRMKPEPVVSPELKLPIKEFTVSRILSLPEQKAYGTKITTSTAVQSAWTMVLSALSNTTDILSMYLVHGRDEAIPGSDQLIGCCISECPLRVRYTDSMPCLDLAQLVQGQMIASATHGHVGHDTIVSECADWPLKADMYQQSSFIQHQTVRVKENLMAGDAGYVNVGDPVIQRELRSDFGVLTTSMGGGELVVKIRCRGDLYGGEEAEAVAEAFVIAVRGVLAGEGSLGALRMRLTEVTFLPMV